MLATFTQRPRLQEHPVFKTDSPSLRDQLNVLFYYRRTAITIMLVLTAIGVVVSLILPPSYTAKARVLALSGNVYDFQPSNPNNARVTESNVAGNVELELLSSEELHRAVVKKELGPGATTDEIDRELVKFENALHVSKFETSNVVDLSFRDRNPRKAAGALRDLLSVYFEARAQILTSGRVGLVTAEREKVKTQLDQANTELEAYERQKGVVDVAAQVSGAVALDGQLRQRKAEADTAVADGRRSVDSLRQTSQTVPAEVDIYTDNTEAAHTVGIMEGSLFQLEARRADLTSRYLPTSPFVKQINQQIAALQTSIEQQKRDAMVAKRTGYNTYRDTVSDRLSQAEAALAGAVGRRDVLYGQLHESENRLKDLIAVNDTVSHMTAQRDVLADAYKDYSAQLEQARLQEMQAKTSGTTNARVIDAPDVPVRRSNPPLLLIASTIVAAMAIALVTVLIMSSVRDSFLSPFEAERALKRPVLCDIPQRDTKGITVRRDFGRLLGAIDAIPSDGLGKAVLLLTTYSEGKLHVVAHGLVAALEPRAPGRVALVRLEEGESATDDGKDGKLAPMRSIDGNGRVTAGIGVSRSRLTSLLHELRSAYDYVIMTAPPAAVCFESVEISPVADLTLLLVQAERTRTPVAQSVLNQVEYIGGAVSGLIMTGRRFYIPAWIYHMVIDRRSSEA